MFPKIVQSEETTKQTPLNSTETTANFHYTNPKDSCVMSKTVENITHPLTRDAHSTTSRLRLQPSVTHHQIKNFNNDFECFNITKIFIFCSTSDVQSVK